MTRWAAFFLLAVLAACVLRLPQLDRRPMHNDEAVNAIKFGGLWEQGNYKYDPKEHHGPALHYLTAAVCRLTGAPDFKHLTENRLRLVTALAGIALLLLLPLIRDGLGRGAVAAAAVFTALSPAMVFYSRYWIHEELLVLFTFLAIAAAWRFAKRPTWLWAALLALALGLMQATKETFVIALAAAGGALALNWLWLRLAGARLGDGTGHTHPLETGPHITRTPLTPSLSPSDGERFHEPPRLAIYVPEPERSAPVPGRCNVESTTVPGKSTAHACLAQQRPGTGALQFMGRVAEGRVRGWWLRFRLNSTLIPIRKCAIVVAVWLVVWVALFTSFFTHFGGLADSIRTFGPWLGQAGASSPHAHSWTFYFERLFWFRSSTGPLWTEGLLLVLGVIGARVGFRRVPQGESDAGLIRFLAFYTALLAAIYAVIPYKTPWCALGFLHGLILLAGVGAAALLRLGTSKSSRLAMAVVLTLGAAHLGWQAWRASFPMCADRGNPWVYAHTSPDLLNLVADVVSVAQAGQGGDTVVEVIAADGDYWPLPWYLRTFNRVGWWAQMPETALAPVVIASSGWSPEIESRQTHVMAGYFQLRPQVFLELHVERGLWEKYLKR